MNIHKFLLRALVVAAVVGPFFWLVFSDEGQRRGDLLLLKLTGAPGMSLNLAALDSTVSEQRLREALTEVSIDCRAQASDYGDKTCFSEISAFNDIPARYITFFFHQDQLRAVKMVYRRAYHDQLIDDLQARHGAPVAAAEVPQPGQVAVFNWQLGSGLLTLLRDRVPPDQEPALMWVNTTPR